MTHTDFILSQSDGRPMYLQIIEQIKIRISTGDWARGEQLPSIRELAVSIKVSVITVKRAYQELEREGVIVTRQGKGSFVASIDDLSLKLKKQDMDKHLIEAMTIAHLLGMTLQELKERLNQLNILNQEKIPEKKQ